MWDPGYFAGLAQMGGIFDELLSIDSVPPLGIGLQLQSRVVPRIEQSEVNNFDFMLPSFLVIQYSFQTNHNQYEHVFFNLLKIAFDKASEVTSKD